MAKDRKPNLLDVLSTASEADLQEINAQIEAKEKELADTTKAIEAELAALRQLARVVDVKLHGKPARKVRQPKAAKAAPAAPVATAVERDGLEPMHAALASQIVALITRSRGTDHAGSHRAKARPDSAGRADGCHEGRQSVQADERRPDWIAGVARERGLKVAASSRR